MKLSLRIICFFFFTLLVKAEEFPLQISAKVDTVLSPYMVEWSELQSLSITLNNTSSKEIHYKIDISIVREGTLCAKTNTALAAVRTLLPGAGITLSTTDVLPLSTLRLFTKHSTLDKRAGALTTSGNYSVCVNITDTTGTTFLAKPICSKASIKAYTLPVLLSPINNDSVPTSAIRFSWYPVTPKPPKILYKLQCYPLGSVNPAQAIRNNQPVLTTIVTDAPTFVWHIPDSVANGNYVWHLISTRPDGIAYGSGDGYSAIGEFTINRTTTPITPNTQPVLKEQKKKKKK
ncbi:MAG: hypothetical protein U0Y96_04520 [Candidatus Kapaibacterium sp.]|nr:hypothetical protein [Bacteroidota bacterium]